MILPRTTIIVALLAACPAPYSRGADAPLLTLPQSVTESRTSRGQGSCSIRLAVVGDATEGALSATVTSLRGIDETGADVPASPRRARNAPRFELQSRLGSEAKIGLNIELGMPARKASVLKRIEGTVELFKPTEKNGGVAIVRITPRPGERVVSPALDAQGVVVTIVGDDALPDQAERLLPGGDRTRMTRVNLQFSDPNQKLVGTELRRADGSSIGSYLTRMRPGLHSYELEQPITGEIQIIVYLASEQAVITRTFVAENIALP